MKSDSFRRYPNIRFIFPHSGGTLPVLANRVSETLPEKRSEKETAEMMDQVKQLYFDVAHATYPAPLSALTKVVSTSQILFGSDYPIVPFAFGILCGHLFWVQQTGMYNPREVGRKLRIYHAWLKLRK